MDDTWGKNLQALAARHPDAARQMEQATPHPYLVWSTAQHESAQVAIIEDPMAGRVAVCSAYRPLTEAVRWADRVDLQSHGVIVQMGFGVGHRVRALIERVEAKGVLIVFEPDPAILRAVMEQVDLVDVLASPVMELVVGPEVDPAQLIRRTEAVSALIVQGVQILTHPATQRHPESLVVFTEALQKLVAFCRTNLVTSLVMSAETCSNLTQNLGQYAAGETTDLLRGAAAGFPAVVVSAGPSLARNVHLLAEPGMRDRVVIIAAQTVLRPLLERGVRPHFVTALDWSQISSRFYEGLPDLPDVTLVAEPKSHPQILRHYPGPIRVLQNNFLDRLLGGAAPSIEPMPAGSTVAHLSFYLAQHLGCDPILLLGQDLAFSEGLYYCPGTAIHRVWAPELSVFNSLETMELKRILRHKAHLRERSDQYGQTCYTDEQMLTYLSQFERDFAEAPQRILDATEGGLIKQHTEVVTLSQALSEHATRPLRELPIPSTTLCPVRLKSASMALTQRGEQVVRLKDHSKQTLPILRDMLRDQKHEPKMDRLFKKLKKHKDAVDADSEALQLIDTVGQLIAFKRVRADRAIRASEEEDPFKRQVMQLDRDIENVDWIMQACDEALHMFELAAAYLSEQRAASSSEVSA